MATQNLEVVIDGDGHVMEDIEGIVMRMPEAYRPGPNQGIRDPFPSIDHLHSANRHTTPPGSFARIGVDGWIDFLQDVGVDKTILYTTRGLTVGKVVSKDWAIEVTKAYNTWMYETYLTASPRFQAMGLIAIQEPDEAARELRRAIEDLGMCGAMLPSTGAEQVQMHLGDSRYLPIYEEADRLGCALGIHGGAHDHMGMDGLSPYAPVHALGHPFGIMINFAGIIFNGILDKYPNLRIGFMESGASWLLTCMERFTGSWKSHIQYDPRGRFLDLHKGETIADYINRHIDEGRIFVGVEGDELMLAQAIKVTGNKPYVYSSDYPHEVNHETCKEELSEIRENSDMTSEDKEAILYRNAERFYKVSPQ